LKQHLNEIIVNKQKYKFINQNSLDVIKNSLEYRLYNDNDTGDDSAKELFNRLLCSNDNKEIEKIIIDIDTLYIPNFINKEKQRWMI
jgi:hypothetical protein